MNKFELLKKIDVFQYIYLNHFCKNVIRGGKGKIIPFKRSVFSFGKDSRIVLGNDSLETNCEKLRGSKAEVLIRLAEDAVWNVNGSCSLNYGCTVEILKNAKLDTQYFTANCNCTIVSAKHITIGNDVMLGRHVVIYDSDFHQIIDSKGKVSNNPQDVIIEDHVWICTNASLLKGSHVPQNTVIPFGKTIRESTDYQKMNTDFASWKR